MFTNYYYEFSYSNAHLHAEEGPEKEHADQFACAISEMGMVANIGMEPGPTYTTLQGTSFQDDYILTSPKAKVVGGLPCIVEFAHSSLGGYHEPLVATVEFEHESTHCIQSRRRAGFCRNSLKDPAVQNYVKGRLAEIVPPPCHVEQSTRSHVVSEKIHEILVEAAPMPQKAAKKSWMSEQTRRAICLRDETFIRSRALARGIKRCFAEAWKCDNNVTRRAALVQRSHLPRSRIPLALMTVEMLLDRAKQLAEEKKIVDEVLTPMRLTAKTCMKQDRAMLTVNMSQRIA